MREYVLQNIGSERMAKKNKKNTYWLFEIGINLKGRGVTFFFKVFSEVKDPIQFLRSNESKEFFEKCLNFGIDCKLKPKKSDDGVCELYKIVITRMLRRAEHCRYIISDFKVFKD